MMQRYSAEVITQPVGLFGSWQPRPFLERSDAQFGAAKSILVVTIAWHDFGQKSVQFRKLISLKLVSAATLNGGSF
jgi:hypothetical protein